LVSDARPPNLHRPKSTGPRNHAASKQLPSLHTALLCGLGAAVLTAAIALPFIGRYGWDRDELYFLSASKHLSLGYVDFPPLTAWIGWLVHAVAGSSLVALRLTGLACGMASVVLVALMVRELGGARRAQLGGAIVWALTPFVLGSASIFHPTFFDLLAWSAFLYIALRILARPEPRLWPLLGLIAGIGFEAKYTILGLGLAFFAGLALTPSRRLLRTPGPWMALGIAVLLAAPNLAWQIAHGWPSLQFISSQNAAAADSTSRVEYVVEQLLFLGVAVVLGVAGVVRLWRDPCLRALALVPILITTLFFFERGRGYYPLPGDTVAVAAGAVAVEQWLRRGARHRVWGIGALAATQLGILILVAPVLVPILPTRTMIADGIWEASFFKDEIGWPQLTDQTRNAWLQVPPSRRREAAILAENYGEASALELYGPSRGLPTPLSGHLSWQYWRPAHLPQRFALLVGFDPATVRRLCADARTLTRIAMPYRLANEERGRTIVECHLRRPLGTLWASSIATDEL
jgi:hypothetical protein